MTWKALQRAARWAVAKSLFEGGTLTETPSPRLLLSVVPSPRRTAGRQSLDLCSRGLSPYRQRRSKLVTHLVLGSVVNLGARLTLSFIG